MIILLKVSKKLIINLINQDHFLAKKANTSYFPHLKHIKAK